MIFTFSIFCCFFSSRSRSRQVRTRHNSRMSSLHQNIKPTAASVVATGTCVSTSVDLAKPLPGRRILRPRAQKTPPDSPNPVDCPASKRARPASWNTTETSNDGNQLSPDMSAEQSPPRFLPSSGGSTSDTGSGSSTSAVATMMLGERCTVQAPCDASASHFSPGNDKKTTEQTQQCNTATSTSGAAATLISIGHRLQTIPDQYKRTENNSANNGFCAYDKITKDVVLVKVGTIWELGLF